MRDDRTKWAAPDLAKDRCLQTPGLQIQRVALGRQMLISGPRPAALRLAGMHAAIGWPDIVSGDRYAVSLRRDRILLVNADPLETGWLDAQGVAVADVTDGYEGVEVSGPKALHLLDTGTELSSASASALRLWHGFGVILYRFHEPDCYRLHVAAAYAEGLWDLLAAQCAAFEP